MIFLAASLFFSPIPSHGTSPDPLVVVIDGAGDLKGCSKAIASAVETFRIPVRVETFPWSHGHGKILKDQTGVAYSRARGRELADWLKARHEEQPGRPIILVSFSAGSAVGLAAGEHLPERFLERHIMLSPSVSATYDIRPSLRVTRKGIDVYCSEKDRFALGVAMRIVGTADESRDRLAAGRVGFRFRVESDRDRELQALLRHHFWSDADAALGNDGRHHGVHSPSWLQKHVMPLLAAGE